MFSFPGDSQSLKDIKMDGQPPVMVKENGEPLSKTGHLKADEVSFWFGQK